MDATLITSHSDKEDAAPTFKRGFGFHPPWAFVDHGPDGTGEPLAVALRPGNAGSNTAADHIAVLRDALRQLPGRRSGRPGRKILIRTDTAWVAETTGLLDLSKWPTGMRVIVRAERPYPGAQLRLTDADGHRLTAFATNTATGGPGTQLAELELRHLRRARAEDRIRCAKDTGLTNLPLHDFDQNRIWCVLVALACEITAWMQMPSLAGHEARRWEPKRPRLRLLPLAGRLAVSARRTMFHLSRASRWTGLLIDAIARLRALAVPGRPNTTDPPRRPAPPPASGTGAQGRHPGTLSYPNATITPRRRNRRRQHPQRRLTKDAG